MTVTLGPEDNVMDGFTVKQSRLTGANPQPFGELR
jgi:hypothetical protein